MQATTVQSLTGTDLSAQLDVQPGNSAQPVTMPDSAGSAQYDASGNATRNGVTTAPATTGDALEQTIAGMVADVRARSKSGTPDLTLPGTPTTSETQTVIIREQTGGKAALAATVLCVAAAAVTLYQVARKGKRKHGA